MKRALARFACVALALALAGARVYLEFYPVGLGDRPARVAAELALLVLWKLRR
jgi:hypothetical protein